MAASTERLVQAVRTLVLAPLLGGIVATVMEAVSWRIIIPTATSALGTFIWAQVFVFMEFTFGLFIVALALVAILTVIGRVKPALLSSTLFPTALCVALGSIGSAAAVYALVTSLLNGSYGLRSSEWAILLLTTAVGGAVTGAVVARRTGAARVSASPTITNQRRRS